MGSLSFLPPVDSTETKESSPEMVVLLIFLLIYFEQVCSFIFFVQYPFVIKISFMNKVFPYL
jgi:hypothetical protein